jgi:hypothetical protein
MALRRLNAATGLQPSRPLVMNLISTLPSDSAFKIGRPLVRAGRSARPMAWLERADRGVAVEQPIKADALFFCNQLIVKAR